MPRSKQQRQKAPARAGKLRSGSAVMMLGGADPALQPYRAHWSMGIYSGESSKTRHLDVPAGKRLVIEFVTISAVLPKRQHTVVTFYVRSSPTLQTPYWFHPRISEPREGSRRSHGLSLCTRIYVDPGSRMEVTAARGPSTSSDALVRVSVSGYLADVP